MSKFIDENVQINSAVLSPKSLARKSEYPTAHQGADLLNPSARGAEEEFIPEAREILQPICPDPEEGFQPLSNYQVEFLTGSVKSIELKSFLAGALSKVSKSLVNNSSFDIVTFVINVMADSGRRWIEGELLNGTPDKVAGLSTVTQIVTAAAATAVTADELIDTQEAVPDAYQNGAIWIMNRATRTAIRKLKDSDGNYLLNHDVSAKWGYTLLGKDVYTSDNMPKMAAGKTAIYYGDMSGLAVKVSEEMNLEVLREKYATQHAVGVVMWVELDSKVENAQKISALKMKESA